MRDHYRRTHARGRQRRPFPLQDRDSCFIGSFAERLCCRGQENGRRTGYSDNRAPAGQFRIFSLILQVEGILYKRGVFLLNRATRQHSCQLDRKGYRLCSGRVYFDARIKDIAPRNI
jgi:hypothetical protein